MKHILHEDEVVGFNPRVVLGQVRDVTIAKSLENVPCRGSAFHFLLSLLLSGKLVVHVFLIDVMLRRLGILVVLLVVLVGGIRVGPLDFQGLLFLVVGGKILNIWRNVATWHEDAGREVA